MQSTPRYLMTLCHSHDEKQVRDLHEVEAMWASKPQSETARVPLPPMTR